MKHIQILLIRKFAQLLLATAKEVAEAMALMQTLPRLWLA